MQLVMERNWINQKSGAIGAVASDTLLSSVEVVSQITKVVSQITKIRSTIHLNMEERPMGKLHNHVTTVTSKVFVPQIAERKRGI